MDSENPMTWYLLERLHQLMPDSGSRGCDGKQASPPAYRGHIEGVTPELQEALNRYLVIALGDAEGELEWESPTYQKAKSEVSRLLNLYPFLKRLYGDPPSDHSLTDRDWEPLSEYCDAVETAQSVESTAMFYKGAATMLRMVMACVCRGDVLDELERRRNTGGDTANRDESRGDEQLAEHDLSKGPSGDAGGRQ